MRRKLLNGSLIGGTALLLAAAPAHADLLREATGNCQASAQVTDGPFIDAYADDPVTYEIPLAGSATYRGQVGSGADRAPRDFNGEVVIKTPPGIPDIELTSKWIWEGSGTGAADAGDVSWDLPRVMPRGVEFRVEGFHQDVPEFCEGFVTLKIAGSPLDSVLAPVALGATAVAAAGVGFAGVRRVGR